MAIALSELERKRCERVMVAFLEKRRPPAPVRPQLDIGYRVTRQSVEIFEIRPRWDRPKEKFEQAVAKATYVKALSIWKVYWQRRDLKWHRYDPTPEVATLEAFTKLVDEDRYGCFFG